MKNSKYLLFILFLAFIYSCKKDNSLTERKVVPTDGLSTSQAKPTAKFEANKNTFYKNDPIKITNISSYPTNEINYLWCHVIKNKFEVFSTSKDIEPLLYTEPTNDTIALIAANKFGTDTMIMGFKIQDVPKFAYINSIVLDSINYINNSTGLTWNTSGGPNLFYKFYDVNNVWIDSTIRSQNNNQFGWSTGSLFTASQTALLTLNDVSTTPIKWKYPNTSLYIQCSKMLSDMSFKLYNKNLDSSEQLIFQNSFKLIEFFRNPNYSLTPDKVTNTSVVKLRSLDGKCVVTMSILFN